MRKKEIINQIKALESDLELLKDELERIEKSEDLERVSFEIELYRKLRNFAKENNKKELRWENAWEEKHCIFYNHKKGSFDIYSICSNADFGQVYFDTRETAKKAIEKFNNDLLKYFRGE